MEELCLNTILTYNATAKVDASSLAGMLLWRCHVKPLCRENAPVSLNILAVILSVCICPLKSHRASSHPHKHRRKKTSLGFWIIQQQLPGFYTCRGGDGLSRVWLEEQTASFPLLGFTLFCAFSPFIQPLFLFTEDAFARLLDSVGFVCHFSARQVSFGTVWENKQVNHHTVYLLYSLAFTTVLLLTLRWVKMRSGMSHHARVVQSIEKLNKVT